jgi:hypothetical protein
VVNDVNEIRRGCFAADLSAVSPNRGVALPIGCCGFSSELGAVREEGRRGRVHGGLRRLVARPELSTTCI